LKPHTRITSLALAAQDHEDSGVLKREKERERCGERGSELREIKSSHACIQREVMVSRDLLGSELLTLILQILIYESLKREKALVVREL
jgi:hypothetical protein